MKISVTLVAATVVLAGVAGGAAAAPAKKSCGLGPDDKGDVVATQASEETKTPDAALDLVMGDVGSDKKTVTALVRVDKLARPAPTSPTGTVYEVRLLTAAGDKTYTLWAHVTGATATYGVGTVNDVTAAQLVESTGTATGVVDMAKSEIRISAPLTALGSPKIGSNLDMAEIVVKRSAGNQYYGRFADSGAGLKPYKIGSPTCVPVGK